MADNNAINEDGNANNELAQIDQGTTATRHTRTNPWFRVDSPIRVDSSHKDSAKASESGSDC